MEVICGPLLQSMENSLAINKQQAQELMEEKKKLERELQSLERWYFTV